MATVAERLSLLREQLAKHQLDGYIVYTDDPHASEYVPASEERRQWISGFTGSAGTVVVTTRHALLWTDGRYYTQAEAQLANTEIGLMKREGPTIPDWLKAHQDEIKAVGVDPLRLSVSAYKAMVSALEGSVAIEMTSTNLVDEIWDKYNRPAASKSTVVPHSLTYTGRSAVDKLARLRELLTENQVDMAVVSQLSEVAWVTNLRGTDIAYTPVFTGYLTVSKDDAVLYVDDVDRVSKEAHEELKKASITLKPYELLFEDLAQPSAHTPATSRVWLDLDANMKLYKSVESSGRRVHLALSPVSLDKATKNAVELEGFKVAHKRDGVAVSAYIAYLMSLSEEQLAGLTEYTASKVLDKIRLSMPGCQDLSFPTISGSGPNSAVIHYMAVEATARKMAYNDIYLVDSGGQYLEGTTDITRTVFLGSGEPSPKQKTVYTLVLKGHLHIARLKVPNGVLASQIDALARQYLWQVGLNFNHGTGHGVGSYLGVHEGPIFISPALYSRQRFPEPDLRPNVVLSDEPGCYMENEFGVRLENLMYSAPETFGAPFAGEGVRFHELTCVPYDRRLIDLELLTAEEIDQVNAYHQWCHKTLLHTLDEQHGKCLDPAVEALTRKWIEANTRKHEKPHN